MYCQLVYICGLIPAHIRYALAELPETLDETYERTLRQISKADWEFAHRLFQFVAVASRPLRVEELVDLLAFDFKAGPIPKFHEGWRMEDPVDVVLSTCSSLLATVDNKYYSRDDCQHVFGKFIQFSHFSVKEYLMSSRLAEATDIIPCRYHISPTVAHTLVAQACLGILLHLDKDVVTRDSLKELPLAEYAAEYWIDHARLEGVWRNVEDGVTQLFDPSKSHLAVCIWIHHPDPDSWDSGLRIKRPGPLDGTNLHYATLWGLHSMVESIVIKHPRDVQSHVFISNDTPLHLALKMGHVDVARVLLEHGAEVTSQNCLGVTPLHLASERGLVELADLLIERGADLSAERVGEFSTPLLVATQSEQVEVVSLLIKRGADVSMGNSDGWTPLHVASQKRKVELASILMEHGADVTAESDDGYTPLELAMCVGQVEVARMLIECGADVTAHDEVTPSTTPLHSASLYGRVEIASMLIERGADVTAQDWNGSTPFHLASSRQSDLPYASESFRLPQYAEVTRMLLKHGADVTARDKKGKTPFDLASSDKGHAGVAQVLLQHQAGSDPLAQNESIPIPSQRVRLLPEAGHYNHSDDVPDMEFIGNDPTGLSGNEGGDVALFDECITEIAQATLQHRVNLDPASANQSISTPSQRMRLPSEAGLYSHWDDVPDTGFFGNDPTCLAGNEGDDVALSDECTVIAQAILQHRANLDPEFANQSTTPPSQRILPSETGLYSHSDDVTDTGFFGSDYTGFLDEEGDDVAPSDEGLAEVTQVIRLSDPVSANESIPTPLQRVRSTSEALYSHSDEIPNTEFFGNDPTGFLDEEGEVDEDGEPRPKRRKVEGGYC